LLSPVGAAQLSDDIGECCCFGSIADQRTAVERAEMSIDSVSRRRRWIQGSRDAAGGVFSLAISHRLV